MRRRFERFVSAWLKHNLTPLTEADIPSFEDWLAGTPYSAGRKAELRREWEKWISEGSDTSKFEKVKSFIKDETYPEWKFPRAINSRVDVAKCYFGPVVQAVSDVLFARPEFIKTVPVPERPAVIRDSLLVTNEGDDYIFTDYTAFEAHFVPEVMEVTQFLLFKHMLQNCHRSEWLKVYMSTMAGFNELSFKHVNARIRATRMSGEMDTSLSNGFANLMLFLFCAKIKGATSVKGFVEGDDGLFRVEPARCAPTEEDFASLGFTIKIGHTKELSQASFCGQVYDMVDLIVVTDPAEVLARMGWTNKRYAMANRHTLMQLLRARGFSLVYQYNGCPLLDVLGRRILDLTTGVQLSEKIFQNMDQWERQKLRAATNEALPPPKEIGSNTRQLVADLYKIPVVQQLELEEKFRSIDLGMHPMDVETPSCWKEYYHTYSLDYVNKSPVWLLKPEEPYLDRLRQFKTCRRFVDSF